MSITGWVAVITLCLTFAVLLGQCLYKVGHISARVESLEAWRVNVRNDLHEVSDKLESMALAINGLRTVIEERTERRLSVRD